MSCSVSFQSGGQSEPSGSRSDSSTDLGPVPSDSISVVKIALEPRQNPDILWRRLLEIQPWAGLALRMTKAA